MRYTLTSLAFGLGASAAVLKRHECSFEITAHGGADGCLGSLNDGQCRIGGDYSKTKFILDTTTSILKDDHGRGCIITESPYQIQCDDGKPGTPGWSVSSEGKLTHDGVCDFAACPVNDNDEWNIYKYTIPEQKKCVYVSLTGNCEATPPPLVHPSPPCPCDECTPVDTQCKSTCYQKPPPQPPVPQPSPCPCDQCKPDQWDCKKTCYEEPLPPAPVSHPPVPQSSPCPCEKCQPADNQCKLTCFEQPKPKPKPPVCCDGCQPWDEKCKVTCYEKPKPKPPVCCDDCASTDDDCHKTCYEKPNPAPKPPVCCDDCQPKDDQCKSICYEKKQPTPPKQAPCPCDECKHEDDECYSTCYEKPAPPKQSPSPVCCDDCKFLDLRCKANCYEKPKTKVPKPSICCDDCKPKDVQCKKVCYEKPKPTAEPCKDDSCKHAKRSEANKIYCGDCSKEDKKCQVTCVTKEVVKEVAVCSDCKEEDHSCKKKYCPPPTTTKPHWKPEPTHSICCDECKTNDPVCKSNCYTKTIWSEHSWIETHSSYKVKPTWVPSSYVKEHTKSFVVSKTKSYVVSKTKTYVETMTHHTINKKPTVVPETWKEIHSTLKPSKSICCDECPKEDNDCHKSCYVKPTHTPSPPKSICCDDCPPHDWECKKYCYPAPPPPTWVPPPPPKPTKSVCCDDCPKEDNDCHKYCYVKPTWTPPPPPPPPKSICCDDCHKDDSACYKGCYPAKPTWAPPPPPPPPTWTPLPPPPPPPPAPISVAPPQPWYTPVPNKGACPADLNGDYQYPHLIVPVNSAEPAKSYGSSYNPKISDTESTIFNFDIPAFYSGKTCSLFFFFPEQKDLETSSYKYSGSGSASWDALYGTADASTSYSTVPKKALHLNDAPIKPGTDYWIADHPCPGGQSVAFQMSGSGGLSLEYFQDYNPKPIGMYIRAC